MATKIADLITLDGTFGDWPATDMIMTSANTATGYQVYGAFLNDATLGNTYVIGIDAIDPADPVINSNTIIYLNTDQNDTTGYNLSYANVGAEYEVQFALDATEALQPYLYSVTSTGTTTLLNGGAPLDAGFSSDGESVELAIPQALLAPAGGTAPTSINFAVLINGANGLPTDLANDPEYIITDTAAVVPTTTIGNLITLDGTFADWPATDVVTTAGNVAAGYQIYGAFLSDAALGNTYVIGIDATASTDPVIGLGTAIYLNTDQNDATGYELSFANVGAEYEVQFSYGSNAQLQPFLYSVTSAGATTLLNGGAPLDAGFSSDGESIELAIPQALLAPAGGTAPTSINFAALINGANGLPTDLASDPEYVVTDPAAVVPTTTIGNLITLDGTFADWPAADIVTTPGNVAAGYQIYGALLDDATFGNTYVIGIDATASTDPVIGPSAVIYLNTDQNDATGYELSFANVGAEYEVQFSYGSNAQLQPFLYSVTSAGATTLLNGGAPLDAGFSSNGESIEVAIPRALLTPAGGVAPTSINFAALNGAQGLPADLVSDPQYTITDPATLVSVNTAIKKVGIVYSATTAALYFGGGQAGETAYSDLFMSAQHQAEAAGVSYDILTEADLTNVALLSQYSALIFPAFQDVQSTQVSAIANALNQVVYDYHVPIITAGGFMTNDENGNALPGNSYANMVNLLNLTQGSFGTATYTVTPDPIALADNNPVMAGFTPGELIGGSSGLFPNTTLGTYTNYGYLDFSGVTQSATTLADINIQGGATLPGVVQTTTGATNTVFATPEIEGDSNLLQHAIQNAVFGTTSSLSLDMTRFAGILNSRNDTEDAQFPQDVDPSANGAPAGTPGIYDQLIPMLQQWQQQYDFVGTYFINVGDNANPANGNSTNWSVSLPYYNQLLQMGNEIGTHSYTHLINPPTVDANGNPIPDVTVNTAEGPQTVNSWSENTNTLYVTPPANGSAPNWTFAYEFGTGNSIMESNIGIPIAGAAVPGANDTVATSDNIEQYYQTSALPAGTTGYVEGGWTGADSGAPNAFGYTDPSDTGSVYIAPNITFDFYEVEYEGKTPAQADADWESLFNQLSANSATPIIVWPWHDYGPTDWNDNDPGAPGTLPYTQAMYTNFIAYAYNAGYEFVTAEDLASRIAAEQAATLSEITNGNVITATVTPAPAKPDLGAMALNVVNGAAGQVIQNAGSWYAYDSQSVFLPYGGGTFAVTLGTTQDDVTHVDYLPMRADLQSLTGDGSNLTLSFTGDGKVDVHVKTPGTNVISVLPSAVGTGAGPVSATLVGDDLSLVFADGALAISSTSPQGVPVLHTVAISESPTAVTSNGVIIFAGPTVAITSAGGPTNNPTQTISGTATEPVESEAVGTTVSLYDNGSTTALATATVQSDGTWSTPVTLNIGSNSIVAKDTDLANMTGTSSAVIYTLGPTITGTNANQAITDLQTVAPFAGVTIGDAIIGQTETVTVALSPAANGTLSNLGGFVNTSAGVYTDINNAATVTSDLDNLVFTPTANQVAPGQTVTTGFTITDTDTAGATATDSTTTVVATDVAVPPTISGTVAGQAVTDLATVAPFATVTIADGNIGQTETVTVTLSVAANGTLSNLASGSYDATSGIYSDTGTAAVVTAALDGLAFTPTANQVAPGQTVTTTFTIADTDTAGATATDNTTTVVATDVAAPPTISGTAAGQATPDLATVTPFSKVTIADGNIGQTETVTVTLSAAANGALSNLGGGTYDATAGVYTDIGTAAAVTSALEALIFTPTANQVAPGQAVTTTFTIVDTDTALASASDSTTTVIATDVGAPTLTAPSSATISQGAIAPIAVVSLAEVGSVSTETFTVTLTDTNGKLAATGAGVSGSGTTSLTISGALAAVNTALATLSDTDATTPSDTIKLSAVDSFGVAAAPQSIAVTVTPGQTFTLTTGKDTVAGGPGNNTIVAKTNTLTTTDSINGGTGTNTLQLVGGGTFNLAAPATLTNVALITAQEGQGTTAQTVTLRAGLNATVNVASDTTATDNSPTITITGAANSDIINLGTGNDTVTLGAGETVNSGGGNDTFKVASATLAGVIINGGTKGKNTLSITGGGTAVMGSAITGITTVQLASATTFTANAAAGLTIVGSAGADNITAGGASQVLTGGAGVNMLTGSSAGGNIFRDTAADLNGDTVANLLASDVIDITDLAPATTTISKVTISGASTVLTLASGTTTSKITLSGTFQGNFAVAADTTGGGGTDLTFVPTADLSTVILPTTPVTITTGPVSTTIIATAATLLPADKITGGTGTGVTNTLQLSGGGAFNLAAVSKLTNIQVIAAQEGQGATAQTVTLKAALNATVNVAPDTAGDPAPGITIIGAKNSDVINLGAGNDTVTPGAGETVNGGTGTDVYNVTKTTIGNTTIKGGSGSNTLVVTGGGNATMGAAITGINAVQLATTTNFTANTTVGLKITGSNGGGDTITLGAPTQSVVAGGPNETVKATAANAVAAISGLGTKSTLDITSGGTITLNANTDIATVALTAKSTLIFNAMQFITADGSTGADTIQAGAINQTLTGGAGADTLIGFSGGQDSFRDTAANLNGDTIQSFVTSDMIDLTNLTFAAAKVTAAANGANTKVTVASGATKSVFTLAGAWSSAGFQLATDGAAGTFLTHT